MASQSWWSSLPQDILVLIFDCVKDPIEIIRCGAACKSWLPTALQVYPKFLRSGFILTGKNKDGTCVLFNLLTKQTRKIQLVEAKEKWICGCSNSWLFMVDSRSPYEMQLLNVFSGTHINLPPFKSLPLPRELFDPTTGDIINHPVNWKLLLSKCPSNSDFVVFLVRDSFKGFDTISSWKPGQKEWTDSNISFDKIYDAILYKGMLYASVRERFRRNTVITCNYRLEVEEKVPIPETFFQGDCDFHLLVKPSNDDCLLVGDSNLGDCRVGKSILEFDLRAKLLRQVNDLGGFALFLGPNHFLAKAGGFGTWFKANCIYRHWDRDFFEYDLETRNFETVPCQCFSEDENYYGNYWVNLDA